MAFELLNAVSYLERPDGVVAVPGLDSYYLAAHPFHEEALRRIHRITRHTKETQEGFLLLGYDQAALLPYCGELPASAKTLMHKHWPGSLVLILPAEGSVFKDIVGLSGQVKVMQPECKLLRSLLSMIPGGVLAVSCASKNNAAPMSTAMEIYNAFGEDVDYVLPGDDLVQEASSPTVVSIWQNGEIHLLRSGGIVLD